jgi:hypothetical protein
MTFDMQSMLKTAARFWPEFVGRLTVRRDKAAIADVGALQDFLATRSTYIAQKTLYGYVKTRMGINYPRMFEDALIVKSLNIAKMQVFAACLSDLTIYAVGAGLHDQPMGNDDRRALALHCYRSALQGVAHDVAEHFSAPDQINGFASRLDGVDWRTASQAENFTASPAALVRWAPIADQLKKFDTEIIQNSVKFAWLEVREEFQARIDGKRVCQDWLRQPTEPDTGS